MIIGSTRRQTPILTYHAVSSDVDPRFADFAVTPHELDRQLAWLRATGHTFLTVSHYVDALRSGTGLPDRPVVLTFDDAYRDFLTCALPLLQRHDATATLYVPTGQVAGTSRWAAARGEGNRPLLDWNEISEVAHAGIEIGGHGHSHQEMDRLTWAAALRDANLNKELLEQHLQLRIRTFAYPFGRHCAMVRHAVKQAGFESACQVMELPSSIVDDPYAVRRLLVRGGLTQAAFRVLVETPSQPVVRVVKEIRSAGSRILRRFTPRLPETFDDTRQQSA